MKAFLVLFIALLPGALALDFLTAREATINTTLASSFTPKDVSGQVAADISFFPKVLQTQAVSTPGIHSDDLVRWEQINQSTLRVIWEPQDKVSYNIAYQVQTFSVRADLPREPYPLTFSEDNKRFLQPTQFITSDDEDIEQLAQKLSENATDAVELSFILAEWVKENIHYNLSTLTTDISQNASWVLDSRTGVCDELTVLFLALTRAAGLPSRYVAGIAYSETENQARQWIPHAWAEVYIPNIGWIPFDITYGQLGWIDASHIVTKTSGHVDDASITYVWEQGDITLGPMQLDGDLVHKQDMQEQPLSLSVRPLLHQVYPGSVVPMRVTAHNPTDMRLASTIKVLKAPGLIGYSDIPMLIDAKTSQDTFVYVQTPEQASVDYDYSTPVVVEEAFGSTASSSLSFGFDYGRINHKQAEDLVQLAVKSERESTAHDLFLHCSTSRANYEPNANGAIVCSMLGDDQIVDICLEETCDRKALDKGSITFKQFSIIASNDTEYKIVAKGPFGEAVSYVHIRVADSVDLDVDLRCPHSIAPSETKPITFRFNGTANVRNVVIKDLHGPIAQLDTAKDETAYEHAITAKHVMDEGVQRTFGISFEGNDGNTYTQQVHCSILLKELGGMDVLASWWRSLLAAIGKG